MMIIFFGEWRGVFVGHEVLQATLHPNAIWFEFADLSLGTTPFDGSGPLMQPHLAVINGLTSSMVGNKQTRLTTLSHKHKF